MAVTKPLTFTSSNSINTSNTKNQNNSNGSSQSTSQNDTPAKAKGQDYCIYKFNCPDKKSISDLQFTSASLTQDNLIEYSSMIVKHIKTHPELLDVLISVLSRKPDRPLTVVFFEHNQLTAFASSNILSNSMSITINRDEALILHSFVFELCNFANDSALKFTEIPKKDFKDDIEYATIACNAEKTTSRRTNELLSLAINKKYTYWDKDWDKLDLSSTLHTQPIESPFYYAKERQADYHGFSQFGAYQIQYLKSLKLQLESDQKAIRDKVQLYVDSNKEDKEFKSLISRLQEVSRRKWEVIYKISEMEKEAQLFMEETNDFSDRLAWVLIKNKSHCKLQFQDRINEIAIEFPREALFSPYQNVSGTQMKCDELCVAIIPVKRKLCLLMSEMQSFLEPKKEATHVPSEDNGQSKQCSEKPKPQDVKKSGF